MRCAVCSRQAKGLGYFNPRLRRSDPRRYNDRWVFCSMPCQNAFSRLMERLTQFQEDAVIDPSDMELAAMASCLAPLGEYVSSIGMQRPLADYSKDEVLTLIDRIEVVTGGASAGEDENKEKHHENERTADLRIAKSNQRENGSY